MTTDNKPPVDDGLVERLRRQTIIEYGKMIQVNCDGETFQSHTGDIVQTVNPDGADAADRIEALIAENQRLGDGLVEEHESALVLAKDNARLHAAIASSDENVEAYAARMKPTLFVGADGDRGPHIRLERSIVRSLIRAVLAAIREKADG